MILTDEFSRQAQMEKDLGIPSALFAAPVRETIELGKSQIGFMNMFAIPLFQGVTDVMPAMGFCVDELHSNQAVWAKKIADEQARLRTDSRDVGNIDGTFSPRHLSVAAPSDTQRQRQSSATLLPSDADFKKAFSGKNSFAPTNGALAESPESDTPHNQSVPEILRSDSLGAEGTAIQDNACQPSQLQLSFATASAPGLLDHPSKDVNFLPNGHHVNGLGVTPSLVTDAVFVDPPIPCPPNQEPSEKQRSSDGTEGGSSAAGDWASQATSATTSKMPLSPSTQGTSITSQESAEKTSLSQTPTQSPSGRHRVGGSSSMSNETQSTAVDESKGAGMMDKVKSLRKKPSRFRMDKLMIWRRSKSASPPVPDISRSHRRTGSQEESVPRTGPPEI
jgi:3',5'-cyclic-nucleotide phosphodiesterase